MSMFSSTLPTIVGASRSAVVKGNMTPDVIVQIAVKKSTARCAIQRIFRAYVAASSRSSWTVYPHRPP